jgi:hypothetical protein
VELSHIDEIKNRDETYYDLNLGLVKKSRMGKGSGPR